MLDADIRRFIRQTVLEAYLNDTARACVLHADGSYHQLRASTSAPPVDAQQLMASISATRGR